MLKAKKLLLLLAVGTFLVGCNNSGNTSSENTSSGPTEQTNFEKFKETYDSLGLNYVSDDMYFYKWGQDIESSFSSMTVEPHGMLNLANRSGFALGKGKNSQGRNDIVAYRYGYDVYAGEYEYSMVPSYKPANYYYSGFLYAENVYSLTEKNYSILFAMPSSEDITELAQMLYDSEEMTFDTMFEESVDADGNIVFTSDNAALAIELLDNNAFARLEGYSSEIYYYNLENILFGVDNRGNTTLANFTVEFTLYEDTFNVLEVAIYSSNFDRENPVMIRDLYSLDSIPEANRDMYDLSSVIPDDFYENGPGAEPEDVKAKRAALKEKITPMIEDNNYTLKHSLDQTTAYTATVYDKKTTAYSGEGFTYGYYYLDPNEDFSNAAQAGLRIYQDTNAGESDGLISGMSLEYYKGVAQSSGYTVDSQYVASRDSDSFSLDERLQLIYQLNFNSIEYYLNFPEFWDVYYGSAWEDQLFYNPANEGFIVCDYYLITALFGCDTLTSNYLPCISYDLNLNDDYAGDDPSARGFWYAYFPEENYMGFVDFGTIEIQNIGTTKLPKNFGTYLNSHYNKSFEVAE